MASNYVGIVPMDEAESWCPNAKTCINAGCPQLIKAYNGGMGGIDLTDMPQHYIRPRDGGKLYLTQFLFDAIL